MMGCWQGTLVHSEHLNSVVTFDMGRGGAENKECWESSFLVQPALIIGVKQSRNRSGLAQSLPGGLGLQISMTFGT